MCAALATGLLTATTTGYGLAGTGVSNGTAAPYVTDGSSSTAAQSAIAVNGGSFTATVPARSLVTYRITGGGPSASPPLALGEPQRLPVRLRAAGNRWLHGGLHGDQHLAGWIPGHRHRLRGLDVDQRVERRLDAADRPGHQPTVERQPDGER
jgi:hypothetical protein